MRDEFDRILDVSGAVGPLQIPFGLPDVANPNVFFPGSLHSAWACFFLLGGGGSCGPASHPQKPGTSQLLDVLKPRTRCIVWVSFVVGTRFSILQWTMV